MKFLCLVCLFFLLMGCSMVRNPDIHDPSRNLTRDDFKALNTAPDFYEEEDELEEPEEELSVKKSGLMVTLDLQGKITLADIVKELAKQLKCGFLIQDNKSLQLSYKVENRPLEDVFSDLEELTGALFSHSNKMIAVRINGFSFKSYPVNYLALSREGSSDVSVNTQSTEGTTNQKSNASHTQIKSGFKNEFWHELNQTIAHILNVPVQPLAGDTTKKKDDSSVPNSDGASYSLNRHTGAIHVYGQKKQHDIIEALLNKVRKVLRTQILIEAKVVEVRLNDEYRSGINWSSLRQNLSITGNMGSLAKKNGLVNQSPTGDYYQFQFKDRKKFNSVLTFMETFGTVRTLSSPRLTVLNNQTALLKVADNLPFFRVKTNVQTNFNANGRQNFQENIISSSEMRTVPVGFIMTVQPSIDPSTREIVLYLKPTITSVKQLRNDPAVEITAKRYKLEDVKSEIPVISVREIDSILRMESGSIAVLGGLMQESANNTSAGLPGLGETPLSFLTHGKSDDHVITELVIFIKASIVSKRKKHGYDKHLYQKFFTDPRPLEHNKRVKS